MASISEFVLDALDNDGADFYDAETTTFGAIVSEYFAPDASSSTGGNGNTQVRTRKSNGISLLNDSGSSANDGYTNDATVLISTRKTGWSFKWYAVRKNKDLSEDAPLTGDSMGSMTADAGLLTTSDGKNYVLDLKGKNDGLWTVTIEHYNKNGRLQKQSFMDFVLDTSVDKVRPDLARDTGRSSTDKITKDGEITLLAETGATVKYLMGKSNDKPSDYLAGDWNTWDAHSSADLISQFSQGSNKVWFYQIDKAGNVSDYNNINFVFKNQMQKTGVGLAHDTGRSDTDGITNNARLDLSGIEDTSTVQYSVNGSDFSDDYNPLQGQNTVVVRQTDIAGNTSDATISFTFKSHANPVKGNLKNDSGKSHFDKVTNDPTLDVTGLEESARLMYSTDGGKTWSDTFAPKNGLNDVLLAQEDVAGNLSDPTSMQFIYKNSVGKIGLGLTKDTGRSNQDKITKDGSINLQGVETDASVEYSTDGGATWTDTFTPVVGQNNVTVRQTDLAGNVSELSSMSFYLKTNVKGMWINLKNDTGKSKFDFVTRDATLDLVGTEDGAIVEYSTDGGMTWSDTFSAKNGRNDVMVRQTDAAGNTSDLSSMSFLYKTSVNGVGVGLKNDTGANKFDGYTADGTLNIAGVEADATVEYSTDGGMSWAGTFTAANGRNTVLVRQTDVAGNVSDPTSYSFVYKNSVNAPAWGLTYDTGKSNVDKITKYGAINLAGIEDGATVQYSIDGGLTWTSSFSAKEGKNSALVRQIDVVGNVSTATSMNFTVDSKAPIAMKWNAMKAASETDLPTMSAIATLAATDDVTLTDFTYTQAPGNSGFNISSNGAINRNSNAVANNTTTILTASVEDQAGNAFSKSFAIVTGSSSADKVSGQSYDEAIYALGGNDTVSGNGGDDVLYGQAGNDILNGGAGQDILYGGTGSDIFKFSTASDSSAARSDLIADFEMAYDKVDLTSIDAVAGGGRTAFKWGGMSTGVVANSVTYYQDATKGQTIVQADITGDKVADMVITMNGLLNLTSGHFML